MNQSTDRRPSARAVLLQRGSELADFADLLAEFGIQIESRANGLPSIAELEGAQLVVVLGKRLLENKRLDLAAWPRTIAVVDDSSRTLVSQLNRIGVSMVIRRPIHPRALRLLLLHEIYCGPEKRGRRRTLIGHPIRVGAGFFKSRAMLLELSPSGARIAMANTPKVGTQIRILLGKELTHARPLKLQATVVRCIRSTSGRDGSSCEVGVSIARSTGNALAIKGILERFALGPASWKDGRRRPDVDSGRMSSTARDPSAPQPPSPLPPDREPRPTPGSGSGPEVVEPAIEMPCERVATPDENRVCDAGQFESVVDQANRNRVHMPEAEVDGSQDRRGTARIPYDRRVVALGEEAARVLVGRDLSPGGMRIDATPSVALGDLLRVALHSGNQSEPVIVLAHVLRDDGDDGLVLVFKDPSPRQKEQLEQIIDCSGPIHVNPDPSEDDDEPPFPLGPIVVAEMLDTVARDVADSSRLGRPEIDSFVDAGESVEDSR